ncbi:probable rRNA maturation factor [Marinobacter daqiaonensis]|uniref:Endoribonuclease YbeY n=1 Tax=Marinobacter daqiaonensis TaxID=650891 RepID=A0A1I6HCL8_9GAMM|nr:rRNA maturation RNase YbeY [Marinobacter daqiaonensis]SFR52193.1 probable rRNA maturation factor [Marinobacter daqiaonensis]
MSILTVDIQRATEGDQLPEDEQLQRWAETAWRQDHDSEVTLRLVDEEESRELNHQYRGKDRPTNVLSFPFEAPAGITMSLAGDLVICAPVVAREAKEQGKSLQAHWAHMVVHGMLHLQGYDHIGDSEADLMEALEIRLLGQFGISNPYETEESEPNS